tara:strand:- start:293 stop:910 length:618 start_codon:yes stop_codon:yes gene_type:complete
MADLSSDQNYWVTLKSKFIINECNLGSDLANKYGIESSTTFEEFEDLYQDAILNNNYFTFLSDQIDIIVPDKSKTMLCIGTSPAVFTKMKTILDRPVKNILLLDEGVSDNDIIYGNVKDILINDSQINNVNIVWYETGHWSLFDATNLTIFNYAKQYLPTGGILTDFEVYEMPDEQKNDSSFSYCTKDMSNLVDLPQEFSYLLKK